MNSPDIGQTSIVTLQRGGGWRSIPNDRIANEITKPNELLPLIQEIDAERGIYEIRYNNLRLTAKSETLLRSFSVAPSQVLDYILFKATETGTPRDCFLISVSDFMAWRGARNRNNAARQLKEGLNTLYSIDLQYEMVSRKGKKRTALEEALANLGSFRILQNKPEIHQGMRNIPIFLGAAYFPVVKNTPPMAYHSILGKINGQQNPFSYLIGRKILEHKDMGRKNSSAEDTLSVATLFRKCHLPTYEQASDAIRKDYTRRVINPFERDLNALSEMCSWRYCLKGGAELPDGFAVAPKTFSSLLVRFSLKDYPKANARLPAHDAPEGVESDVERGVK
jgi:hypothetical protein